MASAQSANLQGSGAEYPVGSIGKAHGHEVHGDFDLLKLKTFSHLKDTLNIENYIIFSIIANLIYAIKSATIDVRTFDTVDKCVSSLANNAVFKFDMNFVTFQAVFMCISLLYCQSV